MKKVSAEVHGDMRQNLKRSAVHIVATQGIENATIRAIGTEAGLNEAYIYRYYEGKDDLLEQTFLEIDQEIIGVFRRKAAKLFEITHCMQDSCYLLWRAYWDDLVENAEDTVFHSRFYHSSYYNKKMEEARNSNLVAFKEIIQKFDAQYGLAVTKEDTWFQIIHMMENTMSYAMRVIRREYENSEENIRRVFDVVFPPIMALICPQSLWNQCTRFKEGQRCSKLHEQDAKNGTVQHCPAQDKEV